MQNKVKATFRAVVSRARRAKRSPTGVFGAEESPQPFDRLTAVIVTGVGLPVALSCVFLYFRDTVE